MRSFLLPLLLIGIVPTALAQEYDPDTFDAISDNIDASASVITATLLALHDLIVRYGALLAVFALCAVFTAGMFGRVPYPWLYSVITGLVILSYTGLPIGFFLDDGDARTLIEEHAGEIHWASKVPPAALPPEHAPIDLVERLRCAGEDCAFGLLPHYDATGRYAPNDGKTIEVDEGTAHVAELHYNDLAYFRQHILAQQGKAFDEVSALTEEIEAMRDADPPLPPDLIKQRILDRDRARGRIRQMSKLLTEADQALKVLQLALFDESYQVSVNYDPSCTLTLRTQQRTTLHPIPRHLNGHCVASESS